MTNDEILAARTIAHNQLLTILCALYLAGVDGTQPGALAMLKERFTVPPDQPESLGAITEAANEQLDSIVSAAERIAAEIRASRANST